MTDDDGRSEQDVSPVLHRIADVLGVPVETFHRQRAGDEDISETAMLTAFRALPGDRERRLSLWFTRQLGHHRDEAP